MRENMQIKKPFEKEKSPEEIFNQKKQDVLDALRRLSEGKSKSFTVYRNGPIQEKLK